MGKLSKKQFIERFLEDQHNYKLRNGFYKTTKTKTGKIIFTVVQLNEIYDRYKNKESMTSIAKNYGCSRQTIREQVKELGVY